MVTIRKAKENDFPDILDLVKALAVFEKSPDKVINTVEHMKDEKDLFHCYVAENKNQEIIGIALCFFAYYSWVGKSLYLEDLYVKEAYRGQGTGSLLLKNIFNFAREENCKRVSWIVANSNNAATELYKKYGANIDNKWSLCDFDEKGIKEFKI